MVDLTKEKVQRCQTACGFVFYKDRVLLVKHRKLGIWLAPGGHVEVNELPHVCALREVYEETGLRVTVRSAAPQLKGNNSQYLPLPFAINLHWISREKSDLWPRGCEQHYTWAYLMSPLGTLEIKQNVEETDGIGWFTWEEVHSLETTEDIKKEIELGFKLFRKKDDST